MSLQVPALGSKTSAFASDRVAETQPVEMAKFSTTDPVKLLCEAAKQLAITKAASGVSKEKLHKARIFLFNVGDFIFRDIWNHPEKKHVWQEALSGFSDLEDTAIARALTSKSLEASCRAAVLAPHGEMTVREAGAFARTISNIIPSSAEGELRSARAMKILQSSIETPQHRFAGLGTVVSDLAIAHKQWKDDTDEAPSYQGFYPLYESDKYRNDYLADFEPYAVIPHFYEGQKVFSTIYRSQKHETFLVSPDVKFSQIFDIGESDQGIYYTQNSISHLNRGHYLGSALAVFAALYRGRKGDKVVDVVRGDNLCVAAPCFAVLKSMEQAMEKRGVKAILPSRVSIMHGPSDERVAEREYLGLGAASTPPVSNTVAVVADLAHRVIPVSRHYRRLLESENPVDNEGLSVFMGAKGFQEMKKRFVAVANGYNPKAHDPKEAAVSGVFARDLDQEAATNPLVFTQMKDEITQALFEAGKIGDPKRPIVYFVGRWHEDKGIQHLPRLTQEAIALGAQVVIMGTPAGCEGPIQQLREMAKNNSLIRVYGKEEQLESVSYTTASGETVNTNAKLGKLVRTAAYLSMVPSIKEALGLVPLEATQACPVLVPYHEGFLDTMIPYKKPDTEGVVHDFSDGATAFTYADSHNAEQAVGALRQAFESFINLEDRALQNKILLDLRKKTAVKHTWYGSASRPGVLQRLADVYKEAAPVTKKRRYFLPAMRRGESPRVTSGAAEAVGFVVNPTPASSAVDLRTQEGPAALPLDDPKIPTLASSGVDTVDSLGSERPSVEVEETLEEHRLPKLPEIEISRFEQLQHKCVVLAKKIGLFFMTMYACIKSVVRGQREIFHWRTEVNFKPMASPLDTRAQLIKV